MMLSISGNTAHSKKREASSTNRRETIPLSAIRWYAAGVMIRAIETANKRRAIVRTALKPRVKGEGEYGADNLTS